MMLPLKYKNKHLDSRTILVWLYSEEAMKMKLLCIGSKKVKLIAIYMSLIMSSSMRTLSLQQFRKSLETNFGKEKWFGSIVALLMD